MAAPVGHTRSCSRCILWSRIWLAGPRCKVSSVTRKGIFPSPILRVLPESSSPAIRPYVSWQSIYLSNKHLHHFRTTSWTCKITAICHYKHPSDRRTGFPVAAQHNPPLRCAEQQAQQYLQHRLMIPARRRSTIKHPLSRTGAGLQRSAHCGRSPQPRQSVRHSACSPG